MKLPLNWLKEYVDFNVTVDEFIEKLMWRGFEVASVETALPGITNVVVGRIDKLEKHPDADKLQICTIDVGKKEPVIIVTAATNVFEGAYVPAALSGANLFGGLVIKPTNMRGVHSDGMLCSGEELGITDEDYEGASTYGILILKGEQTPGTPIAEALGMDDVVFDIEITPNRADCQSIIGMCREAAAALGQKFIEPKIKEIVGEGNAEEYAQVTISNNDLCPRYTARVVTDLKIEPSPSWMQKKLKSVGLRPINNIVDITNYVMVEYGHPMHAFDLACVKDGHIIVRTANDGEKVTTLDEKEYTVDSSTLLIADPEKGVAIAGVMGGLNSEITENTKASLFESAVFLGSSVRNTTRKIRHTTDAAARFIKGVEAQNALLASNRAIELIVELNAGKVVGGLIDACTADTEEAVVEIDTAHVNKIINTSFTAKEMSEMLAQINITSIPSGDKLNVTIPHYRTDIENGLEADWNIAEEIARIYGYNKIPSTLMQGDTFRGGLDERTRFEDTVKDTMAALGLYEMYNYNFTGPAELDALLLAEDSEKRQAVKILNPFGEDQSLMRTTLASGMLKTMSLNYGRKTNFGRFFEVGNVHFDNNDDIPEERLMLGISISGTNEDFFTLKGIVETLLKKLGFGARASFKAGGSEYLTPGQKAIILVDNQPIGEMGTVHPFVQKNYSVGAAVYMAEIELSKLAMKKRAKVTYTPLPKYPLVARDIAILVNEQVTSAEVIKAMKQAPIKIIIGDIELFDVYRGKGVPEGKKSMAYSFTLRAEDRTLTDDDIKFAMEALLKALKAKVNADLRM